MSLISPFADQSFWADLCQKRKLGPQWFWVDSLTPKRMQEGIVDVIKNFEEYTRNAEELAKSMAKDDAVRAALKVLEAAAAEARKHMPTNAPVARQGRATAEAHVQLMSSGGGGKGGAADGGKVKVAINEDEGNRVRVGFSF